MSELLNKLKTYYEKGVDAKSQNAAMIYEDKFRELCWAAAPAIINALSPPKLPRVSPEDLVEGRWYVALDDGVKRVCRFAAGCMLYAAYPNQEGEYARFYQRVDEIWGPIPEFELEANA